jgi:hypothetical protein
MRTPTRAALLSSAALLCAPAVALAGMPSLTLTDVARLRLQTISFFLAGLLLSAWLIKLLWNYLRRDFAFLPRLTYGKAVGAVVLWGLLFVLVLTMISGARELMTPGAWEKNGFTYRLARDAAPPYPEDDGPEGQRWRQLEQLRAALWQYARSHGGELPTAADPDVPAERWSVPGAPQQRYLYVEGQQADRGATPLAYEPGIYGARRLVLLTNGEIRGMEVDDILKALPPEKP